LPEDKPALIDIRPLDQADPAAVETLLDAAFGADRRGRTAYRLREGLSPIAELSFAAFDGAALIGTIQCWPVELAADAAAHPIVLVGPVAVLPGRQRDGIGRGLMMHMLAAAQARGVPAMALIGDPEYYSRFFGFTAAATGGWELPGPVERHRLLAWARPGVTLPATGTLRPRSFAAGGAIA
jgi:predicted N-acetyltransferase YhbS